MHHTPSDKGQLSSSLKERLKRCGRYHASPPVAKQPETINKLQRNSEFNRHEKSKSSTEHTAKRLCTGLNKNEDTPVKSEYRTKVVTCTTTSPNSSSSIQDNEEVHLDLNTDSELVIKKLPLNETPSFQRRKSDGFRIKGSKLSFESGDSVSAECAEDVNTSNSDEHIVDTHKLDTHNHDGNVDEMDNHGNSDRTNNHGKVVETDNRGKVVETDNHGKVVETDNHGNMVETDDYGNVDGTDINHGKVERTLTKSDMIRDLALKDEELRKLKMVKMYRSKNNLCELQTLIDKWREVSQQALQDLHEAMSDPKPSLTQLINHLGIDHQLIRFTTDNDEEDFY